MHAGAQGSTLIETLVSTVIMGILACAFMSILLVNYKTNAKLSNMQDTMNAVRQLKERIAKDVREGRSLGDVYGADVNDQSTNTTYVQGSDKFPSSADPIYGGATAPPVPPGWAAATVSQPYQLGNRCLIVQVPILDDHADANGKHSRNTNATGWPTQIPGSGSTPPQDNVETHVYQVLPDPHFPGEWTLQFASFGGAPKNGVSSGFAGYDASAHTFGPETLVTGIIGPMDANNQPKVFQFVSPKLSNQPADAIPSPGSTVTEYTGVICNFEVRRHQDTGVKRTDISLTPVGMKLEVFLRNNALATSVGQPVANQIVNQ